MPDQLVSRSLCRKLGHRHKIEDVRIFGDLMGKSESDGGRAAASWCLLCRSTRAAGSHSSGITLRAGVGGKKAPASVAPKQARSPKVVIVAVFHRIG